MAGIQRIFAHQSVESALHVLSLLGELCLHLLVVVTISHVARALFGVHAVEGLDTLAPQMWLRVRDELVKVAAKEADEAVLLEDLRMWMWDWVRQVAGGRENVTWPT